MVRFPRLFVLLVPAFAACAEPVSSDEVAYSGWVYDGPSSDEAVLSAGALVFTVAGETFEADQPYEGYPGYWRALLPPGQPFELRVQSEAAWPSVWAGDTPASDGSWFAGALFTPEKVWFDELVSSLELPFGSAPGALADGAVHLWGLPNDPDAWDCATVLVQGAAPHCFAIDDEGALTRVTEGPFDWFFAFDLAPGEVALSVDGAVIEAWHPEAGEVVMALWLEHG